MNRFEKVFSRYPGIGKLKYSDFYNRHFSGLKPDILLEIGVAKGLSLRAWKHLFPSCRVVGIDIDASCKENNPDLEIYIGDQKDTEFLSSVLGKIGTPDIIIDDGGHKRSQQIGTFKFLFPKMNSGGLYIVEDLQTGYLRKWNDFSYSMIDYLKTLLSLNGYANMNYTSLTFEPNNLQSICLLRK